MRSIWKGALSFGLVNIPIRMYWASREKEVSFVLLHKKDLGDLFAPVLKENNNLRTALAEIKKLYDDS